MFKCCRGTCIYPFLFSRGGVGGVMLLFCSVDSFVSLNPEADGGMVGILKGNSCVSMGRGEEPALVLEVPCPW